jgi:hypothetical protein
MRILSLCLLLALIALQSCKKDPHFSEDYETLRVEMRSLWHDHVLWTRNVIICIVDNAPGQNDAVNRLLKNQEDIGNAFKPYYGDAAGNTLTELLKVHINTAATLVTAARDGDTPTYNSAAAAWYANADDIAVFLHNSNPDNWELTHWKAMMKSHLDHTATEVTARINQDYALDVATYDVIVDEIEIMADELTDGIADQYPKDFVD